MTSGPAARLLAGFCALAGGWLAGEKVRCEIYGGRFDPGELERVSLKAPAVRAGCLAIASVEDRGDGAVECDFQLAAVAISRKTSEGEPSGGMAARLAARVAFELAQAQDWPGAVFSAAELDPGATQCPRGRHVGDPREIRAANMYRTGIDTAGFSLWAVTWRQQFLALASDFDVPAPEPPALPETVLAGMAPEIGREHEQDYEQVAPDREVSA